METKLSSGIALRDPGLFREASYIDGGWLPPTTQGAIAVDNPATGDIVGSVPRLGRAETRAAVDAAARAFPAWRLKTAK